jgi:hypothetical protein
MLQFWKDLSSIFSPTSYEGTVVDVRKVAGDYYRVRHVVWDASLSESRTDREGYEVDKKTSAGWTDQKLRLGPSTLEDFFDWRRQEAREAKCRHPNWEKVHVPVGGEMVRGEKCTDCGALDYF